ncbi:hypothetical protein D9M69_527420 [compost metagenome]
MLETHFNLHTQRQRDLDELDGFFVAMGRQPQHGRPITDWCRQLVDDLGSTVATQVGVGGHQFQLLLEQVFVRPLQIHQCLVLDGVAIEIGETHRRLFSALVHRDGHTFEQLFEAGGHPRAVSPQLQIVRVIKTGCPRVKNGTLERAGDGRATDIDGLGLPA